MLLEDLRIEVARYARKMYESRLVRATQGNVSLRDPQTGLICIKPSGREYETLTAEDIVVIDEDSKIIEGRWQPSSETLIHTCVLKRRRDIHCVMHTHSIYASAFSVANHPVPIVLQESVLWLGRSVPVVPFEESGTAEFARHVADTVDERVAVLWGNHGAMTIGETLAEAFSRAHALEDSAQTYTIACGLGTPRIIPDKVATRISADWFAHHMKKE